jgi:hypothetical protein
MPGGRLRERDKGHQFRDERVPEYLEQELKHQHKKHAVYPDKGKVDADVNRQEPVQIVDIDDVDVRCLPGERRVREQSQNLDEYYFNQFHHSVRSPHNPMTLKVKLYRPYIYMNVSRARERAATLSNSDRSILIA